MAKQTSANALQVPVNDTLNRIWIRPLPWSKGRAAIIFPTSNFNHLVKGEVKKRVRIVSKCSKWALVKPDSAHLYFEIAADNIDDIRNILLHYYGTDTPVPPKITYTVEVESTEDGKFPWSTNTMNKKSVDFYGRSLVYKDDRDIAPIVKDGVTVQCGSFLDGGGTANYPVLIPDPNDSFFRMLVTGVPIGIVEKIEKERPELIRVIGPDVRTPSLKDVNDAVSYAMSRRHGSKTEYLSCPLCGGTITATRGKDANTVTCECTGGDVPKIVHIKEMYTFVPKTPDEIKRKKNKKKAAQ